MLKILYETFNNWLLNVTGIQYLYLLLFQWHTWCLERRVSGIGWIASL